MMPIAAHPVARPTDEGNTVLNCDVNRLRVCVQTCTVCKCVNRTPYKLWIQQFRCMVAVVQEQNQHTKLAMLLWLGLKIAERWLGCPSLT